MSLRKSLFCVALFSALRASTSPVRTQYTLCRSLSLIVCQSSQACFLSSIRSKLRLAYIYLPTSIISSDGLGILCSLLYARSSSKILSEEILKPSLSMGCPYSFNVYFFSTSLSFRYHSHTRASLSIWLRILLSMLLSALPP